MPLCIGDKELDAIYSGDIDLQLIYCGDNEIWSNNKVIDLGTAQSFNVATILADKGITNIDVSLLTVDNFLAKVVNSTGTAKQNCGDAYWAPTGYMGWYSGINKTYSNGILTFYNYATAADRTMGNSSTVKANINVILITKPEKLISLGTNISFNVKTLVPSVDYTKLTEDNFFTDKISPSDGNSGYSYGEVCYNYSHYSKSYDPSTGILNWKNTTDRGNNETTNSIPVYLCTKKIK